jgi:deferrochelatase/peroxidase EfeB
MPVQSLIRSGAKYRVARHFVLAVAERSQALALIHRIAGSISTLPLESAQAEQPIVKSIGFSYRGLVALGLQAPYLQAFDAKAPAFSEGAVARAARRLADTGASAAEHWQPRFKPNAAHVLISLHATDPNADFDSAIEDWRHRPGLTGWEQPLDAANLRPGEDPPREHFGYADGVSKVAVKWPGSGKDGCAPGEFLLGYENDAGFDAWKLGARPETKAFFQDGTFGALRVIEQDVRRFDQFVYRQLAAFQQGREYVMAKLCGRWPNGMRIKPDHDGPPAYDPQRVDEFDFKDDPNGYGCPFGSHIRRLRPRADPVVPSNRTRRVLRRGMPYGRPFEEAPDQTDRGMLGHFFCASLEDQFEHLLAEWGNKNPMGPDNRGNARDPLSGQHEADLAAFEVPMAGGTALRLTGLQPFVTTRGTLYAFYPSQQGLEELPRACAAELLCA